MGVYSIKDLENFTHIKAHTLRIWEQRYNLLSPERTDTNIRLYSDRDLKKILNINLLYNNGLKISKIAKLKENEIFQLANELLLLPIENEASQVDYLINKIMDFDEFSIIQKLDQLTQNDSLEHVFSKVLIPVLQKIGELWQVDSINISHEHFFSSLIRDYMIRSLPQIENPREAKPKVLLFLRESEFHELALVFYNYYLRQKGYATIYLGQSLPMEDVELAIRAIKPDLIFTSLIAKLDEREFVEFFERIEENFDLSKLYVGGYQITIYKHLIPSDVNAIFTFDCIKEI